MIPTVVGALRAIPKDFEKTGGIRNQQKNRDRPDICIVKIG